jgi:chorismate mutase/prephenate dehydratase
MAGEADPDVARLREQLTGVDERILEAVNTRLGLVGELKRVKETKGIDFRDPGREEWLLAHLAEVNGGPLSDAGVRALWTELLALTKRELGG